MPPSSAAFRELLDGLDPDALAAFVAALYEARGRETDRVDGDVLVSDGEGTRRLAVRRGADPSTAASDADADAVVIPIVADDDDVVDADDLRRMSLYAVDDPDRTRLFRRFFGVTPDEVGDETDPDTRGAGGDPTRSTSPRPTTDESPPSTTSAVTDRDDTHRPGVGRSSDDSAADDADDLPVRGPLLFGVLLLLAAVVGLAVGPGTGVLPTTDGGTAGDAAPNDTTATPTPTADPAGVSNRDPPLDASDVEDVGGSAGAVEGPYPPGVDADGIENASALATAHREELSGRSYRLSVVDREFVGGQPTAAAWERTVVESPTRYRSTVEVAGTFREKPRGVADATTYADGTERFVRLTAETDADGTIRFVDRNSDDGTAGGDGWRSVAITREDDPFATRTASYLRRALDVENSRLLGAYERHGTRYVWIELRARPPSGAVTLGSVLVDERGLVHEHHREYAYVPIGESSVRTTTTVRITTGNVTADPPSWR
ncbi:hypothetical protein [Haloplanus salilacus]|uniref:hypothetical protein n=1 Tax=Haloplanus salilacus TaxID=2949994 RepID=UPI0030D34049